MRHIEQNGRHALAFGYQKINIHTQKGEFQPAAAVPTYGSLDLCILTQTPLPQVRDELLEKAGPFWRALWSVPARWEKWTASNLRDPDGNLVELSHYREEAPEK